MEKIKHVVETVKDTVTCHHGHEHKHDDHHKTPAQHTAQAPGGAGRPDPPTHGHAHSNLDPPGAPGIIETPAPGVAANGSMMPGLTPGMIPRI